MFDNLKSLIYRYYLIIDKKNFFNEYKELMAIPDFEGFENFREFYLKKLLLHVLKNVPYYRNLKETGIINNDEIDLPKFFELPILKKEDVKKNFEMLKSTDYKYRNFFFNQTGGSKGKPLTFIQDSLYLKWFSISDYYYNSEILKFNKPITTKKLILWGSEKDLYQNSIGIKAKASNWLTNTIFLNSFRISEENLENYIKTINSYKPDLIRGYANSLYQLSKYIEKNNISVHQPKIIQSAAENLTDDMRSLIERSFGIKVFDFYGSREVSHLAGECKCGLMHILPTNYIEILDQNNEPVSEGEEGRVIVTNLFNYSMPLVRYEIGDMAVLGPEKCECGNILPTIKKVTGRITDYFVCKNGTTISPEFFIMLIGVYCNSDFINQFQVLQKNFQEIEIIFVPTENYTNQIINKQKSINEKIKFLMGDDCQISWKSVNEIPKTESGKYIYTKSLVHNI